MRSEDIGKNSINVMSLEGDVMSNVFRNYNKLTTFIDRRYFICSEILSHCLVTTVKVKYKKR